MKKISYMLAICSIFTFTQCTTGPSKQELQTSNDSLQRVVIQKDSAMFSIMETFTSIEDNLQAIKDKENIITMAIDGQESKQNREDQINSDIQMIYQMMVDNRNKVAQLEEKLRKANVKNSQFKKIIASLEAKIQEKDAEILRLTEALQSADLKIEGLNNIISSLNTSVDSLRNVNMLKQATIEGQDEALNTAYYVIGSEKELKELGILDKRGKFSIGSKKTKADFSQDAFTTIDIRESTKFNLNGVKKAKVITAHPLDSYTIYGEKPVDSLVVTNYHNFWSSSKYLVIVVTQ